MKTKKSPVIFNMIWKLCLLCAAAALGAVQAGPIRKTKDRKEQLEEVNVLMYGVIQLSESLNYAHKTTETKIARISQTLKSHEGTLHNLEEKAEKAVDVEKQMKAVIGLLQEQMTKHEAQTKMSKDLLTTVEKEGVGMNTKVKKLEMDLDNCVPLNLRELQVTE